MARGIRNWSEELIARRIREGYGDGEGASYKPWVRTADFTSAGRTSRVFSSKFGRTFELVSDVETNSFYMLEFAPSVIQVYEQFRLDRDETLQIAAAHGIAHPCYPGTHVSTVMTADFLVVMGSEDNPRLMAIDCKRSEHAGDPRAIEKLEITRRYFAGRDVPHRLVFHSKLPLTLVRNIEWARGGVIKPGQLDPSPEFLLDKADLMVHELRHSTRSMSLSEYCVSFEQRHGLRQGLGLRIARMLIWEHRIQCGMTTPHLERAPMYSFTANVVGPAKKLASGE
ncbi:transposon Tn7 transposition protein TnsA [Paraburkholderia hospita]|uniref:Transposon Tn7 transposition protein TnsA n=1 Tax=Paraburkholderia hospita TaxID=169430 RepID=A0ABN0FS01_9BURK|nr:heteromeric transposase endonuclease subunit TnsA [Paraburkholderia hospita]EIN01543.1 transposon Tn7 transposition protein TnsA [Paraburkholderia hospita]OUL70260.1 heteromeric transposase endonuclease subunit TnsA [Paraburkholderia hospita]